MKMENKRARSDSCSALSEELNEGEEIIEGV